MRELFQVMLIYLTRKFLWNQSLRIKPGSYYSLQSFHWLCRIDPNVVSPPILHLAPSFELHLFGSATFFWPLAMLFIWFVGENMFFSENFFKKIFPKYFFLRNFSTKKIFVKIFSRVLWRAKLVPLPLLVWFLFDCEVTLISGSGKNMFVFSGSPRVWSTGIGDIDHKIFKGFGILRL